MQVINELLTHKRYIKLLQDNLLCSSHVNNKKKQVLKCLLKCVTPPDLSEVPLMKRSEMSFKI